MGTNIMKLTLLLVLASCFLEVPPEPVTTLAILGGVAAVVAITSHTVNMSVKLWSSLTKNHCWPKEIDANAEFDEWMWNSDANNKIADLIEKDPSNTICEKNSLVEPLGLGTTLQSQM